MEACASLLPPLARALNCAVLELGHELQITPAQVKVLLHLSRRQQMTIGEIADALHVSMPAASEIVDRLVETGHVGRTPDPADRRRMLVSATPAAHRATTQLINLRHTQVRNALLRLSPADREAASRVLEALIAEMGGTVPPRHTLKPKATSLT